MIVIIDYSSTHRRGTIRRTRDYFHDMGRRLWRFQRNLLRNQKESRLNFKPPIEESMLYQPVALRWDFHSHYCTHCSIYRYLAISPLWTLWYNYHRTRNHWSRRPKQVLPNDDSRHSNHRPLANDTDGRDFR